MRKLITFLFLLSVYGMAQAQISASLMQHPDVSDNQVCFVYGDDVWIAPKTGGTATRLSSPEGAESYPRFSPDGSMIAYTANYQGNSDVYVIPVKGGIPNRLTYHGMADVVLGWTPDGKSVLFASSRESGRQRYAQFYTIPVAGGSPIKLPVPYGFYASFSPDGKKIAFTDISRVNRNWKRYRGGMAPDITVFDLSTYASENITNNDANDELPMWVGNAIYYMSDAGPNKKNNIWKYDLASKKNTQMTHFKDYDITFPGNSNSDIIFEAGGQLYLYNMASEKTNELKINLVSDQRELISQLKKVDKYTQSATVSPDGNRVIVQARGELFDLPATEGFVSDLTQTPGAAERNPSWSPDGKTLAYWSDASGEYQLVLRDMTGNNEAKTVTSFSNGFRYDIFWSPDSKKLAFIDQAMNICYYDVESGKVVKFDRGKYMYEGGLRSFRVSWSPDSKLMTYSHSVNNRLLTAVFLYDTENSKLTQLTSGYYADANPVFSADGKYLFYSTNRSFDPVYSDLDNTFIYPNSTQVVVGTLTADGESILAPKNDETKIEEKKKESEEKADKSKKDKKGEKEEAKEDKPEPVKIDTEGFEDRVEVLDIKPGNIGNLSAVDGKLIYVRYPNAGAPEGEKPQLKYYDIKEREVKTIAPQVSQYSLTADGKKMLVSQNGKMAVINVGPDQKIEKTVPTQDMAMEVVPKEEWRQIFTDVWRIERDFFYDPNMHGVDWNAMKSRYGQLIEQANSRNDVNIIIGDLIAELNASHTYNGGGDIERASQMNVGYLGADLKVENGAFRIKKIITGAPWDIEVRSPLDQPGVKVNEGDYILAVNGQKTDVNKPISAAFQGMAGSTVQLTVNSEPNMKDAKKVLVKLLSDETRLRHLAWIESNREKVDKATDGKIGYVYVRSTGVDGQNELIRQYYGQIAKEGFIIDERFNSGGQIPDRFVELLNRKPLAFFAVRDGKDWQWPPAANFGPKVMLINGFSGSGGDAFPDYFRKSGLGPVIGTRTWGGLIGISGAPALIDNGSITVPTFRMYDPDGKWFKEGHGVDPDIKVPQDYQKLAKGDDEQLDVAIKEVMKRLNSTDNFKAPERPAYEKR
ncbi:PDZ domain-containing protein [Saccharicrinis sp. FJH54]|uniref:S41 family peptidase n=1 Tax=Saccharicrinis sp. FJH54 TaxID=3344665 RepID=UPI0035D427E8